MVLARHALRLALATALAVIGLLISFVVAPAQDSSGVINNPDDLPGASSSIAAQPR